MVVWGNSIPEATANAKTATEMSLEHLIELEIKEMANTKINKTHQ